MLTTTHSPLSEALTGAVVLPGDARWDEARSAFNLLLDQHPAAVAFPADADDVVAAVAYARAAGLRVAPQATAHNQGPLGGLENTLLVNVSALQEVRVDPATQRVRVGAGVKWDRVAPRLSAHGLAGLHGSSPDVGIAGYSLGGGMGWLARKHGLQANAVTAMELVTADGSLVRADAEHHADLFWALRGGGGNYGVVTAIEFAVHPVDELYAGALFFPFERSSEVLHAWSDLLPTLPDELMSWASVMHFPPVPDVPAFARGRSYAVVMAAYLGDEAEGRALLKPLRDLGPERDTFATVPPVVLGDLAMDPLDPVPFHLTHQLMDDLPAQTIDELMAKVGPDSGRGPTVTILQFRHMGGALARATPGAGARATLPGEVCMIALGAVFDEPSDVAVREALADIDAAVLPHAAGEYPNFVEVPADASRFFDPAAWDRLREVKRRYDPADLFAGNHHVPPAGDA
ncbi:MAG TPA: FAD-binding oxidoreductase [Solirubrobacteraceae bacterium]|nr:FAD-binding oxidoreductase [Solirubrobacteraceae bacterium]